MNNGLIFEKKCKKFLKKNILFKNKNLYKIINKIFINASKHSLYKIVNNFNKKMPKKLIPDDCFINLRQKQIFILEMKYQEKEGSTDEKIQTGPYKLWYYKKLFPSYKIYFSYVFNDWYKQKKYQPEISYLLSHNIQVFYISSKNYEAELKKWLSIK